jgi:hypothetical protein
VIEQRQTRYRRAREDANELDRLSFSNAFAACAATILELPMGGPGGVPDVPMDERGMENFWQWAHEKGLHPLVLPMPPEGRYWPGYSIAGIDGDTLDYCVVCLDGNPVYNPHPEDDRPLETLELRWTCVFNALDPSYWFKNRTWNGVLLQREVGRAVVNIPYPVLPGR